MFWSKNKDLLYVALYARGGQPKMPGLEDTYHWALLTGPKTENKTSRGYRYHAREFWRQTGSGPHQPVWAYECGESGMAATNKLLLRVVIGKVKDQARLEAILKTVPMRPDVPGWNCVEWVKEAFEKVVKDGKTSMGTCIGDWTTVRDAAMWYVTQKKAAGRWERNNGYATDAVPTWDMLQRKETEA